MDFEVCDIPETAFSKDATGGKEELTTATLRFAGEADGQDELAAEMWGSYGFASRPAKPDGENKCQALAVDSAGKRIVVATRDNRGADCHGALNAGDVAVWSTGKNSVRCNADGSMAMHQIGDSVDAGISIEKDGTILIFNQWGQIELGPNGLQVFTATGEAMKLGGGVFQALAPQAFIQGGVVGLGPNPSKPLTTGVTAAVVPLPYLIG